MKHYKIFLTLLLGFFVSTFIHTESNAQVSSIGSVSTTRGSSWTLDGYIMSRTVSKLLSPSNFGPGGVQYLIHLRSLVKQAQLQRQRFPSTIYFLLDSFLTVLFLPANYKLWQIGLTAAVNY